MSHGDRNCPFFILMIRPVLPAAISRSVCRARNAGICSTSQTSAAACACDASCMSVRIGSLSSDLILPRIRKPSFSPGRGTPSPRTDSPYRMSLINVWHSGIGRDLCNFLGHHPRVLFAFNHAWPRNQKQRIPAAEAQRGSAISRVCSYEMGKVCKLLRLRSQRCVCTI